MITNSHMDIRIGITEQGAFSGYVVQGYDFLSLCPQSRNDPGFYRAVLTSPVPVTVYIKTSCEAGEDITTYVESKLDPDKMQQRIFEMVVFHLVQQKDTSRLVTLIKDVASSQHQKGMDDYRDKIRNVFNDLMGRED